MNDVQKAKKSEDERNVNYDTGAELLHHFQLEWNEIHELTEINAQKAQEADGVIATIHEKLEQQWNNISVINNTLAVIPKINNSLQNLMDQIGKFFL